MQRQDDGQQGSEGDVEMADLRGRGERGGARLRRRKRRKQGLGEVEMEAAEVTHLRSEDYDAISADGSPLDRLHKRLMGSSRRSCS